MLTRHLLYVTSLGMLLSAFGFGQMPSVARANEAVTALPEKNLPAPPRKPLPVRDCLTCPGPPASASRFRTHRALLYYGTYPWDDDPVNGFDGCPQGQRGYPGAALSLGWIRLHDSRRKRAGHRHGSPGRCSTCNAVPHYFQSAWPSAESPQTGATY